MRPVSMYEEIMDLEVDSETYCECCQVVQVDVNDKHCPACVLEIVEALAEQYNESTLIEKGLY